MAASPHPSRNLALVAVVVVTAIVVAVVLGLGSDDSADKTVVTRPLATTTVATTSTTMATAPTTTVVLPDGDYAALCAQMQGLVDLVGPTIDPDQFRTLFAAVDFDGLIAAAPDGIKPYVETMRDQRQQVLDVLAGADAPGDLPPDALSPAFFDALQHLQAVGVQKCGFGGG